MQTRSKETLIYPTVEANCGVIHRSECSYILEYTAFDLLTLALAGGRHFVVLSHDHVRSALLFLAFHAPQRVEHPLAAIAASEWQALCAQS